MEPESIRLWTCQAIGTREKLCDYTSDGNIRVCSVLFCSDLCFCILPYAERVRKRMPFVFVCCRYVSPDYASTGMLNEGSDVYSFGVLLMEIITGRSPVDYSRPPGEVTKTLPPLVV